MIKYDGIDADTIKGEAERMADRDGGSRVEALIGDALRRRMIT
jgi:hypothetical protein